MDARATLGNVKGKMFRGLLAILCGGGIKFLTQIGILIGGEGVSS